MVVGVLATVTGTGIVLTDVEVVDAWTGATTAAGRTRTVGGVDEP
jgi:hypothetical protein